MDLNQIQLKPLMLADLYGNNLVETGPAPAPPRRPLKYLGENKKNTVIVVNHPTLPVLPDEELHFLTTVLSACKLNLADIVIVNFHSADETALQELLVGDTRNVLLFGVAPLSIGLPINFPHYQVQPFSQRTYLHAPSLSEVEKDKNLKMQLWNGLKQLFGL
jgi:hypothetical protein